MTFPASASNSGAMETTNAFKETSFLGYDWIAGALDNDSSVTDQSDGFFEELKEFRRVNRDECISSKAAFNW